MNDPDWLGLRDDDLTPDERDARRRWLDGDPQAAREHRLATTLGETLATLDAADHPAPTAADILSRAREKAPESPRRPWWPIAAVLAAAGLLTILALPTPDGQRARGVEAVDASVRLEAVVDGSLRVLESGDVVDIGTPVVFYVTTSEWGRVSLEENAPTGREAVATWFQPRGRQAVGGTSPLAWTSDSGVPGVHTYRVQWCDQGGETCVEDALSLRFSAP